MGPPINMWPSDYNNDASVNVYRSNIIKFFDRHRAFYWNFTIGLIILQIIFNLSTVRAGPVMLSPELNKGPVTLARNIRHLPCISRRTGEEGVCMFAIDCLKSNGSHLGTCIDRFYFGSCCQIPDPSVIPPIDDNSIDNTNFVHPQTEDKESVLNATTEKNVKETAVTQSHKINPDVNSSKVPLNKEDEKITTTLRTTVKEENNKLPEVTTEIPMKLSTFQTVSGDKNPIQVTTQAPKTTTSYTNSQVTIKPSLPTKKPLKPTYKPRPTFKPLNFSRPSSPRPVSVTRPKPVKPVSSFNVTRIPPYRPPPKRPTSTKKPLPLPPRLNITIIPQSTSSKPIFTRPALVTITYINTTTTTPEPVASTTTPTTTTTQKLTTLAPLTSVTDIPVAETTTIVVTSSQKITSEIPEVSLTTERFFQESTLAATSTFTTTKKPSTTNTERKPALETSSSIPMTSEFPPGLVTWSSNEETTRKPSSPLSSSTTTQASTTPQVSTTTQASTTTVSTTPVSTSEAPSSFSPVTTESVSSSSPVSSSSQPSPTLQEESTTPVTEDTWSPITPPEGWILISTVTPKEEQTIETTQSQPTTVTEQPILDVERIQTSSPVEIEDITTEMEKIETAKPAEVTTTKEELEKTTLAVTESTKPVVTTEYVAETTTEFKNTESVTTVDAKTTTESVPEVTVENITTEMLTEATITGVSKPEFTVNISMAAYPATEAVPTTIEDKTEINGSVTTVSTAPEADKLTTTSTAAPPNTTTASTTTTTTTESYNMTNYKEVCGRRLVPEARIVGGSKSLFGMWPWQVSLRQWRTSTYLHKCGAALLNENWAITAAHCVEHVPPGELLVRLGEHDLANEEEPYGFAERRVQLVASHPHFDPATFEYDLSLLRFYEPVNFQPNILPVCVPDDDEDFVGRTAHVTGWGRLYDEGPLPSVLQEVNVPVINNSACESMYQVAGYNEHIPHIFICAGYAKGGFDSCEGDSGGPMVLRRSKDNRFVLGGIISWGIGCAEPNQPGVYTRISEFRDWINQILQF